MDVTPFDERQYLERELLRFTTAGSVDDGKSTLIGRLLYDSKAVFRDQLEALERVSELRGESQVNLALLTDGLRAEREQGITIDVAYRYFSTPRRKFIIADTPGHEQYTRNMITGASTADLALILIDARNGVLTQSRRHGIIASLLGISHVIVAVNKMDLMEWSQAVFDAIVAEYTDFSSKLDIHDISFIPVSALQGDNIVDRSRNMPWYDGPTVLSRLETVTISADRNLVDFRFPVQYVVRPHQDFRGFAGRVASGTVRPGQEVMVLPSRQVSRVKEIVTFAGCLPQASEAQSVVLTLEDEIDVSRGDMLVRRQNLPITAGGFEAILCWMDDGASLKLESPFILRHTTRTVRAFVKRLRYRIDVNTLHRQDAETLSLNEIGRVEIHTAFPLFFDPYVRNRETGSFVLIDPATHRTVAAGMIREETRAEYDESIRPEASDETRSGVTLEARERRQGHRAQVVWFTGFSGSGKTTLARAVEQTLFDQGRQVVVLDEQGLAKSLNQDLAPTEAGRIEGERRLGRLARLFYDAGFFVLVCAISPKQAGRDEARSQLPAGAFTEIHLRCHLEECRRRDPNGFYRRAEQDKSRELPGVHSPYEVPLRAELTIDTDRQDLPSSLRAVLSRVE